MLGVMQGRLSPPSEGRFQSFPREQWAAEFPRAASAGIEAIEWIYDVRGRDANPLASDQGIERISQNCVTHGVVVRSICADYFMERAFVRATAAERQQRLTDLLWLIERARRLGVQRIVLPFVDQSAIRDEADCDAVVETLHCALPCARACGIELHLETSLAPAPFAELLDRVRDPRVRVNYDSGNSSSLGYLPAEEFAAYGNRLGGVHIKDRLLGGGTVPLGSGNADLPAVFGGLRQHGYRGDFILQAAREAEGEEVELARRNLALLRRWLDGEA